MNFTAASFRGVTPDPNGSGVVVGLTRIELVTSSLSGMRSNRLSYSPLAGLKTLSVRWAGLNRPGHHFFFKNRDPYSPHQFGDEVENNGSENPHTRAEGNAEDSQNGKRPEQFCPFEGEGIPTKRLEELLHIVNGARRTAHVPQQHTSHEDHHVQGDVEDKTNLEDAPGVDVPDGSCDPSDATARRC